MSVIVEGVETFEELAYLEAATRIRLAQGYYFARPMSFDEIPLGKDVNHDRRDVSALRELVASRIVQSRTARRVDRAT